MLTFSTCNWHEFKLIVRDSKEVSSNLLTLSVFLSLNKFACKLRLITLTCLSSRYGVRVVSWLPLSLFTSDSSAASSPPWRGPQGGREEATRLLAVCVVTGGRFSTFSVEARRRVEGTVAVATLHPATLHPAGELSSLQVIRSRAGAVEEVTPSRHINRATVLPQWSMPPSAPAGGSSTSSVETKEGRPVTVGMRLLLT